MFALHDENLNVLMSGLLLSTDFKDCANNAGVGATGITIEAADLILEISRLEDISVAALAVTWQWETGFQLYPKPNTNGKPENMEEWDVGPFHVNIKYTNLYVKQGKLTISDIYKSNGIGGSNIWGDYLFDPNSTVSKDSKNWIASPFSGNPLANGRVAARRLKANGGSEENQVKWYAPDPEDRAKKYNTWRNNWKNFFACYQNI